MVSRPVSVSPIQNAFPVVDLTTGRATETFQRFLLNIWERTGGFTDEFFEILTVANLGQIQGLIATGQNEALARQLGDVAAQGRLNSIDRLSQELAALGQQVNLLQGVITSGFRVPIPTRVVSFAQNDTWQLNPDIKAIVAFAVGGGGGGAGGTAGTNGGGGGGGANYSLAFIEGSLLPETVAVTVGAGGTAGTSGGNGGAGGDSTFGGFCAARGGYGGLATGTSGAVNETYGGMFRGGSGGAGATGGDGSSAPNDYPGAPGGGGGAYYAGTPSVGGNGGAGNSRSLSATGGGGSGGLSTGSDGGSNPISATFIGPGFGGGGGGSAVGASGSGGAGYNGAGGGGGAARPGNARPGGIGGQGRVWVLEYY